jgi:hypothetical protein
MMPNVPNRWKMEEREIEGMPTTLEEMDVSVTVLRSSGTKDVVSGIGPKPADNDTIGKTCPACGVPFETGDHTSLVPLGPGADRAEQVKCAQGRPYNGIGIEIHHMCAQGRTVEDRLSRGEM